MAQPRWTAEDDALLIAGYRVDMTLAELAEMLGATTSQIDDRIRRLRDQGADLPPRRPRWTTERRHLLAKRRRQGASLRELEHEFAISRGTLTSQLRTLRKLGFDVEPAKPKKRPA